MSAIPPENAEHLLEYVRKLANRAGISPSFLARVENGIQTGISPLRS